MNLRSASLLALLVAMASPVLPGATTPARAANAAMSNDFWWPDRLDLTSLRQHAPQSNPYGATFDYAAEFKTSIWRR